MKFSDLANLFKYSGHKSSVRVEGIRAISLDRYGHLSFFLYVFNLRGGHQMGFGIQVQAGGGGGGVSWIKEVNS